jgi:Flp pilus assembly protein TadG
MYGPSSKPMPIDKRMTTPRLSSRGQVVVLFLVMLPVLLGIAALAVDVVYAFTVKAALVTAVDAAVLAGSRDIVNGSSSVAATVDRTFRENLPTGYLATGAPSYTPNPPVIVSETDGSQSISLVGSATSPTFFMNLFGYRGIPVKAYSKASRRDVNVVLVLDRSTSLDMAHAWDDVQAAAKTFVQQFDDTRDKIGLVSFGSSSKVDFAPRTSFRTSLVNLIDGMHPLADNRTNSALGMYYAYSALRALNDTTSENIIVHFTDGQSTAFPGQFDVKKTGSNPKCPASPQEGSFFTGQTGGAVHGIFQFQPPTSTSHDYTVINGCGLDTSGSNGPSLLTGGFRDSWIPAVGPPVSVYGDARVNPNAVGNGDTVIKIGDNMLVNVAKNARRDPLKMRIYTIGLGGWEGPPKEDVLRRVANVSPYTDPDEPVGMYVYAPTQSQLAEAFRQVASSISRLVQ